MAIIPRYSSRALPPGAQTGLIESARARGRAGAGLALAAGGAVVAAVEYKGRKDADKARKSRMFADINASLDEGRKSIEDFGKAGDIGEPPLSEGWKIEFGGPDPAKGAAATASSRLDSKNIQGKALGMDLERRVKRAQLGRYEALLARMRASGVSSAKRGGAAAPVNTEQALAAFDAAAAKLLEGLGDDPELTAQYAGITESNRKPYELRLRMLENERRLAEARSALEGALDGLVQAAADDPAMAPGVAGRGLAQIQSAMEASLLDAGEASAMQSEFVGRVHISAMRGQIAEDPEAALEKLESGELDDVFEADARETLIGEAHAAARVKAAGASAAARARRRGLELDMEEHLAALAETGIGDEALDARARAELPDFQYAAFRAAQVAARERHAARAEYAFMTADGIEADIAAKAPGGGPRDTDERAAAHAIRLEIRDEVLAARAADPAGWAMRDADVAAAFAAAQENPEDPALSRKAAELRLALQREMGIEQPRLLSEAEREALAEELAALPPTERLARIGDLKGRYGDRFAALAQELAAALSPDTEILMARLDDPLLTGVLARGMERDGVEFKGARHLWLPLIDGRLDKSRLEDKQLYQFTLGNRILRVVYDRKADALVPALAEEGNEGPSATPPNLPDPSRPEDTVGEVAGKFVENVPAMFKKSAGGILQAIAESAGPDLNMTKHRMKPGQTYDEWRQERIDAWRAEKGSGPLARFGADLAARAAADLEANAPNVDPDSLKGYAYDISSALVQMAPAVAASVGTRNPNVGLAVLGAQVYGDRYAESRAAGRTEVQAHTDATFYALTEAIPERIPLGILMKQGSKFLPRLTQTMAAEGVQEMFTEVLQTGYDAGILDEEMTWGEAWDRIKRAGIVGTVVGGGTTTFAHPFVSGASAPESSGTELAPEDMGNDDGSGGTSPRGSGRSGNRANPEEDFPRARARKFLRPLVAHLPDKWRASFDLAEFMDRAEYPLPGQTAEQYFEPVWDRLSPQMQMFLKERYRNFAGEASEQGQRDTLERADFKLSKNKDERRFDVAKKPDVDAAGNSDGQEDTEARVFDDIASQEIRQVFFDLFAVPKGSNRPIGLEFKLQSATRNKKQESNDERLVEKSEVASVAVLRMPADRIKPEHLADAIDAWLDEPKRRNKPKLGKYRRSDVIELVKILRKQRGPDGRPLSIGAVIAITLSFVLPLAYPDTGDADEQDPTQEIKGR